MAMSKEAALDTLKNILLSARSAEQPRLQRIAQAMRNRRWNEDPTVEIAKGSPPVVYALARKSQTNFLPLVVKTFSQALKVDNYYSRSTEESAGAWADWQRNQMDAKQTGLHRGACTFGASYLKILPGDRGPVWRPRSALEMTAVYGSPSDDEWPMYTLEVDRDLMILTDEECDYWFGMESRPRSGLADPALSTYVSGRGYLTYLETRVHGVGVTPVVRYRDRMLLEGEEQFGIVEPLLQIQGRIDETTYQMMVAQYFAAFKQRYAIGWVPDDEAELMAASSASLWTFDQAPETLKLGEFQETDLTRYIASKNSGLRDLGAVAQLPMQTLGVDGISNTSADALAGLQDAKDNEVAEIGTSLGESHEQSFRLSAHIAGDEAGAEDYESEVQWKDSTAKSFNQQVQGLVAIATGLNVPVEVLWPDIPGWTKGMVQRATDSLNEARARAVETDPVTQLNRTLDRQSATAQ